MFSIFQDVTWKFGLVNRQEMKFVFGLYFVFLISRIIGKYISRYLRNEDVKRNSKHEENDVLKGGSYH